MNNPAGVLYEDQNMLQVMEKFDITQSWWLPVLDKEKKFTGFISKTKVFNKYREILSGQTDLYNEAWPKSLTKILFMNIVMIIGLAAAFCTTVSFLPQAIKTIATKNTSGISLNMYYFFTGGTLLWFIYGLLGNNIPIIIANGITLVLAAIILAYKIKYR